MPLSEDDLLIIQGHIEDDLTQEQETLFKSRIADSEEFLKQVIIQKKILAHLEVNEKVKRKKEMLSDFRTIRQENLNKSHIPSKSIWYSVAASLLLLATIFIWGEININSPESTFVAYYKPYDGVVITRSEDQAFLIGMDAYNSEQYAKALNTFLDTTNNSITKGKQYLLIGNCYMNLDKTDSSLLWFNKISNNESSLIQSNRDWYTSLALLSKGEIKESQKILENIINSKTEYAQKAAILLKEDVFN